LVFTTLEDDASFYFDISGETEIEPGFNGKKRTHAVQKCFLPLQGAADTKKKRNVNG
jgi:hypothetical protein